MYVKKDETFIPFSERYLNLSPSLSSKKIINNDEKSIFSLLFAEKVRTLQRKRNAALYKQDAFLNESYNYNI